MIDGLDFLDGGGEASRMIRERDWTGHPLGHPASWSPELKATLSLILNSPESMILSWGEDLHFFFNETYFPLLGPRLPWAMGERFDKVWADGWDQAKPIIDAAYRGQPEHFDDLPWKLGTDRGARDTWWSFSYSRVLDAQGAVAGLFIFTNETTRRVLTEAANRESHERLRLETERQRLMLQQMPGFVAILSGPEHVFEYVNDAYVTISGVRDFIGRSVREVFPELAGQGFYELLDEVFASGKPFSASALPIRLRGETRDRYIDLLYQPIRDDQGALTGIFVGGYDVTQRMRQVQLQAALTDLGDRLRGLIDLDEVTAVASDVLAHALGVSRAGFGTVNLTGETIVIHPDWHSPSLSSLVGSHRFRDYGSFIDVLKAGQAVIIADVMEHKETRANADAFASLSTRAMVNLPVIENGRFVLLTLVHQDTPRHWTDAEIVFIQQVGDRVQSALAQARAEGHQRVLNLELDHRLKNTLAMVQAIASQTLRGVTERDAVEAFSNRIQSLAQAHDVLVKQSWSAASMASIIKSALVVFDRQDRFRISGPELMLTPRSALSLSLLIHELGTNAMKYGALSVPEGSVAVTWEIEPGAEGNDVVMEWREQGGPTVNAPASKGFGSRLIRMGLSGAGGSELRYEPSGFVALMRAPLAHLQNG